MDVENGTIPVSTIQVIGEYSTLMEEVGFRVVFAQHFDRPTH